MASVGFSGSRLGMTPAQLDGVREVLDDWIGLHGFTAHHGLCVGADAQFHEMCREPRGGAVTIVGHPGPDWPDGELCAWLQCDQVMDPSPHMHRNQTIVRFAHYMIAAPPCDEPQRKGGTWATIRMALRALRSQRLVALYVVGRDGRLLDHKGWKA